MKKKIKSPLEAYGFAPRFTCKENEEDKIKVRTFIIFPTWKSIKEINPYILDCSDLDVSDEELSICIDEQVYGRYLK